MPPSSELQELVLDRLIATGASDHKWCDYVLAALQGEQALAAALEGLAPSRPLPTTTSADGTSTPVEPPGVFVASIAVAGFRGIGPRTTLPLKPGRQRGLLKSQRRSVLASHRRVVHQSVVLSQSIS